MVSETLHGGGQAIYLQQLVCTSSSHIEDDLIRTAFAVLIARHEALRLRFHWSQSGEASQSVAAIAEIPISEGKWTGEQSVADFLRADRDRGLELRDSPLIRVRVFHPPSRGTTIVITNHHAILDGRSRLIVTEELFQLCMSAAPTEEILPAGGLPFTQYLEWRERQDFSGSTMFWQELLSGAAAACDLPLPAPLVVPANRAGTRKGVIHGAETDTLKRTSAENNFSLNNLVQAAWAILIARYQGTDSAVFGSVRACRHSAAGGRAINTVGVLINTVPVRCGLGARVTAREVGHQLRHQQLRARDHENTPLAAIVATAGLGPGEQLINTYLMFENARSGPLNQWTAELHEETGSLSLSAVGGTCINLTLDYPRDRYTDAAMERFLDEFIALLTNLPANIDKPVDSLEVFTPSLVFRPGYGAAARTVIDCVRHWALETPGDIAVCSSRAELSWRELEDRSNEVAHWLGSQGVTRGTLVGLSLPRTPDLIVACLAVWKAGGAYVPIDPLYPENRREYMIADSGVLMVLTSLPAAAPGTNGMAIPVSPAAVDPAYVIYTSGSTGKPKGVVISHGSLANLCVEIQREYKLMEQDRVLQASTISFDISVEEIFPTLWTGATIVLRDDGTMSSLLEFLEFTEAWQCTVLNLPTAFWHEMVQGLQISARTLPASTRLVVVGGERVLPGVYQVWKSLPDISRVRWLNTYGPTEATVTATLFDPAEFPANALEGDLPIGRPLGGVNAYVLDHTLRPVPLEVAGELFIGGAGVALGYLNSPDVTAGAFLPDPFVPGGRMYRTGDEVRLLAGGQLDFIGRTDFQVKFRGFRLEPGEIEKAAESHPAVHQAVLQIRDGSTLALFAAIVKGSDSDEEDLRDWLSKLLPTWMVPDFIVLNSGMPVTMNGKLDRAALSEIPLTRNAPTAAGSDPETALERQLVTLRESLFQKSPIGVNENFFSLGGYSLLAMRMLVQAERLGGRRLAFRDLNRAPTIRQMAALLAGTATARLPECLVDIRETGAGIPLFCFHGAGGVVHWYNDLALEISDRPIFGVQSLEAPEEQLPGSVEEMAEAYFTGIRKFQPRGPYCFLGHSMGGMLAYHCSVLAERAGEPVMFTGILDGWNRNADHPGSLKKLWRWAGYFLRLTVPEKKDFVAEKLQWLRREQTDANARRDAGLDTSRLECVKAINVRAARKYTPPAYEGTVHVFRARQRSATEAPDATLGWGRVAAKVIAIDVHGSHYSLLSRPNVESLARTILAILRQCHRSE